MEDLPEGQTHYENDGCGEPEHNRPTPPSMEWEERFDKEFYECIPEPEDVKDFIRKLLQEKDAEIARAEQTKR